ncbi:hypothetical protein [Mycolicibacterium hodleri]|uniref:Cullin, a subunit of E3 ubiquitin ligase n=1 Tax=Mycolicibacterium hodleri TaxID=49897 RepID=A0A502EGL8_9MYCO|nr:hypothetical protein [Mycolicibacterium hodleri]TPG36597.1 hypothetical protein EAH80_01130 [Mycolicibacterium hodleri]
MGDIFRGTEAIAGGDLTEYALRRWYQPIFRDVYVPKRHAATVLDRTHGAWLWSRRRAVITGVAASTLHGAEWVDDDVPIELLLNYTHPPRGIVARNETTADDETMRIGKRAVTTPARTAFDLGRHLERGQALARLDALMRARPFSVEDVMLLDKRYPGARGVRRLRELLPLVDGGAMSPRETRLRLLFIDAGFPTPTTQIPVVDERGRHVRTLDMGWEEFKVAAEYDGDQHRTDRVQYVKDLRVWPILQRLGWDVTRVIKEDRDGDVIARTRSAMVARGWKP